MRLLLASRLVYRFRCLGFQTLAIRSPGWTSFSWLIQSSVLCSIPPGSHQPMLYYSTWNSVVGVGQKIRRRAPIDSVRNVPWSRWCENRFCASYFFRSSSWWKDHPLVTTNTCFSCIVLLGSCFYTLSMSSHRWSEDSMHETSTTTTTYVETNSDPERLEGLSTARESSLTNVSIGESYEARNFEAFEPGSRCEVATRSTLCLGEHNTIRWKWSAHSATYLREEISLRNTTESGASDQMKCLKKISERNHQNFRKITTEHFFFSEWTVCRRA